MCIIATQLPDGISLQILDLFISNSHRYKYIFTCSTSCLRLTFPDLFYAQCWRAIGGPWSVIMPQTLRLLLFVQTLGSLPPTASSVGSESHVDKEWSTVVDGS